MKTLFSSHQDIHILSSSLDKGLHVPISWELEFSHTIESCHDIISCHSYVENIQGKDRVWLVVSFLAKKDQPEDPHTFQLNIYQGWITSKDSWSQMFHNKQSILLDFIPFYVQWAPSSKSSPKLLVSSNDQTIRTYVYQDTCQWSESTDPNPCVPANDTVNSSSTAFYTLDTSSTSIYCYGYQNGALNVILFHKESATFETIHRSLDGPISFIKLYNATKPCFTEATMNPLYEIEKGVRDVQHDYKVQSVPTCIHMVVGGAVGYAIVFRDITKHGLNDLCLLPDSDKYDTVLCCDVVFCPITSTTLILIGTYGQKILMYEEKRWKKKMIKSKSDTLSGDLSPDIPYGKVQKSSVSLDPMLYNDHLSTSHKKKVEEGIQEILESNMEGRILGIQADQSPDFRKEIKIPRRSFSSQTETVLDKIHEAEDPLKKGTYTLKWIHTTSNPVFYIQYGDYVKDGMDYIVIATSYGVHLMQWDIQLVKCVLIEKFNLIRRIYDLKHRILMTSRYDKHKESEIQEFPQYSLSKAQLDISPSQSPNQSTIDLEGSSYYKEDSQQPIDFQVDTIEDRFGMVVDFDEEDVFLSTTPQDSPM